MLRHAKSSWETSAPDFRRPLAERGVRDGVVAGRLLATYPLDVVVCSAATRARQTWERAVVGGARCDDVRFEEDVYYGGTRGVLELLRALPESVGTALVVGHEPTVSDLVLRLAAEPSDLTDLIEDKFPTAAVAVLAVPGPWRELDDGSAVLTTFEVPRA